MEVERAKEEARVLEKAREEREGEKLKEEEVAQEARTNAEDDERKKRDEIRARKQKERDEKTAFQTTPGLRPLAEPPMLDWDHFFPTWIPCDLRYEVLFPHDPEKRAARKDIDGGGSVLYEYRVHAESMRYDPETGNAREAFYNSLALDLAEEYGEVFREPNALWTTTTELSRLEFLYLDNDGKTTEFERWISKGADIFDEDDEIRQKYQHLLPPTFVENSLATFEFRHLNVDRGTYNIHIDMMDGNDILAGWPQEVQEKLRIPPPLPTFSAPQQIHTLCHPIDTTHLLRIIHVSSSLIVSHTSHPHQHSPPYRSIAKLKPTLTKHQPTDHRHHQFSPST